MAVGSCWREVNFNSYLGRRTSYAVAKLALYLPKPQIDVSVTVTKARAASTSRPRMKGRGDLKRLNSGVAYSH